MAPKLASRLFLVIGVLALGIPEAEAVTLTGHAAAAINQFIAIVENKSINFAIIAPTAAGGNVVISPTGTITAPGGFLLFGTANSGAFTASSFAGFPAVVGFGGSTTLADGAGHTMTLGTFTNNAPGNFDGTGNLHFNVGATLTVGANQAPGSYSGTYTVTVDF